MFLTESLKQRPRVICTQRKKTLLTKSFHNALIRPCPVIPNRDTVLVFCDREATIVLLSVFTQTLSVYVISLAFCYLGCIVVWSFRLRSGSGLVIFSQTVTIFCIQIATFSYFTSRHTGWKKLSSLLWLKRVLLKQTFRKMSLKNIFFPRHICWPGSAQCDPVWDFALPPQLGCYQSTIENHRQQSGFATSVTNMFQFV